MNDAELNRWLDFYNEAIAADEGLRDGTIRGFEDLDRDQRRMVRARVLADRRALRDLRELHATA